MSGRRAARAISRVGVVAMVACAGSASRGAWTAALPPDLAAPVIVRQAEGTITDAGGHPVAGAVVAVIDLRSYRGIAFTRSDHDGRFAVGVPSTPAIITATAPGYVVASTDPAKTTGRVAIALGRPSKDRRRFAGVVVDADGRSLAGVRLRLMRWDWPVGATFYTTTNEEGRFELLAGPEGPYDLLVDDPRYVSNFVASLAHDVGEVTLTAYRRDAIVASSSRIDEGALRELCVPLAGGGIERLAESVRDARVVGLGESTHGTHEYAEVRTQLLEALARDGWLTTIAVENSWEEVARVDAYVRRGVGTSHEAVAGLAYWPWQTEEFVAMVEAVRAINDQRPDDRKIEFVGIDYTPARASVAFFDGQLADADPSHEEVAAGLAPLGRMESWLDAAKLSSDDRARIARALAVLERASEDGRADALPTRLGVEITKTSMELLQYDDGRDRLMADAVITLLAMPDRARHVAIWAHEGHLARAPIEGEVPMGASLRQHLGDAYRAIGTAFFEGSFRVDTARGELVSHAVTPPPPYFFESALHRISPSAACALDVGAARRRPELRAWISAPLPTRLYGALEISEEYPFAPVVVPDLWSAVIFVPTTTPTTPLAE